MSQKWETFKVTNRTTNRPCDFAAMNMNDEDK